MNQVFVNLGLGAVISTILVVVSVRSRNLTGSGGVGAIVIGTVIYGYGGWTWYGDLLAFFFSSSILTKVRYQAKAVKGVNELKSGARTVWQTIGTGGVAAFFAGVGLLFHGEPALLAAGFVGALAEANSDTWAVELGVLSKRNPRLITRISSDVPPGTSGGISSLGELSAIAGSLLVAFVAEALGVFRSAPLLLVTATAIAAVVAEHLDSVLGATVQAAYYCPQCHKETERKIHRCGARTRHVKGFEIMTNEAVNLVSTAIGATLAIILYIIL